MDKRKLCISLGGAMIPAAVGMYVSSWPEFFRANPIVPLVLVIAGTLLVLYGFVLPSVPPKEVSSTSTKTSFVGGDLSGVQVNAEHVHFNQPAPSSVTVVIQIFLVVCGVLAAGFIVSQMMTHRGDVASRDLVTSLPKASISAPPPSIDHADHTTPNRKDNSKTSLKAPTQAATGNGNQQSAITIKGNVTQTGISNVIGSNNTVNVSISELPKVSEIQVEALSSALPAQQFSVHIWWNIGDQDAEAFGTRLQRAFTLAHWRGVTALPTVFVPPISPEPRDSVSVYWNTDASGAAAGPLAGVIGANLKVSPYIDRQPRVAGDGIGIYLVSRPIRED